MILNTNPLLTNWQYYGSPTLSKIIAVAGIGYVGLSNAVLLAARNTVRALDVDAGRVAMLNDRKCPIIDDDIARHLATQTLDLTATTDPAT